MFRKFIRNYLIQMKYAVLMDCFAVKHLYNQLSIPSTYYLNPLR